MQLLKTNSSTINETRNTKNSYSSNEGSQGAIPISCQDIYNCVSDAKAAQELLNSFSCSSPLEKNLLSVKEQIKEKEELLLEFKQEVDRAAEIERRFESLLDMGKLTCSNCHQKKSHQKKVLLPTMRLFSIGQKSETTSKRKTSCGCSKKQNKKNCQRHLYT